MARPKPKPPRHPPLGAADCRRVAERLRLVSDPTRLRLLRVLDEGERAVGDLAAVLGSSDATTSHHLANLRAARVVDRRKDGHHVYYSPTDKGRELVRVAEGILRLGTGGTSPKR